MKTYTIVFKGIDDWNRPVFKVVDKPFYFGSVNILFDWNATEEKVLQKITVKDLEYFGTHFNCEPNGGMPTGLELKIVRKKEFDHIHQQAIEDIQHLKENNLEG